MSDLIANMTEDQIVDHLRGIEPAHQLAELINLTGGDLDPLVCSRILNRAVDDLWTTYYTQEEVDSTTDEAYRD